MPTSTRIAAACLAVSVACTATPSAQPSPSLTPTSAPIPVPTTAGPTPIPTASPVPPPAPSSAVPLPSFVEIDAPSSDTVWVAVGGALLFRSQDRGMTWQERPLPQGANTPEISFVSAEEGWLMSVGSPGTGCQGQSVTIFHTADGGSTYERAQADGIPFGGCKRGLSFIDARRGFVSTWQRGAMADLYRTQDGGRTWTKATIRPSTRLTSRPDSSVTLDAPQAFGDTLLTSASDSGGPPNAHIVYRSTDGGATWSAIATVNARAFAFVTATRWIDLSTPGEFQETNDAGSSWRDLATDYSQAAPVPAAIVFADASVGYATVRGSIQRTMDGGAHWTQLRTPGT